MMTSTVLKREGNNSISSSKSESILRLSSNKKSSYSKSKPQLPRGGKIATKLVKKGKQHPFGK